VAVEGGVITEIGAVEPISGDEVIVCDGASSLRAWSTPTITCTSG